MRCGSSCGNCETDDGEFMTVDVLKDIAVENNTEELTVSPTDNKNCNETDSDSSSSSTSNSSPLTKMNKLSLETCSVTYFSGYLAKNIWINLFVVIAN